MIRHLFRATLVLLTGLGLAGVQGAPAQAQDYSARPTTIIIGQPAGASPDLIVRHFGKKIQEKTGRPWLVENRPGGGGVVAGQFAAAAPKDGYTIYLGSSGAQAANKSLFKKIPYDPVKDYEPVARLFRLNFVLMVNPTRVPVNSLQEFTTFLKNKSGRITYGHFSASMKALAEQYLQQTGIKAVPVAYGNSVQMMKELAAGELDFIFGDLVYAIGNKPDLRALAIASEQRSSILPNLPTMVEAGMTSFKPLFAWFGIYLPAGAPAGAADKLAPMLMDVLNLDETRQFLSSLGAEPFAGTKEELARFQEEETVRWAEFVKLANITPE